MKTRRDFSNLDGEVINYDAQLAISPVTTDPIDRDDFYPADGVDKYGSFENLPSFSNAIGDGVKKFAKSRLDRRDNKKDTKLDLKKMRNESRTGARTTRANAKLGNADASKAAAESLGKDTQSDILLAQSLNTKPKKTGMSTGAKVGIAIAVAAVLSIGGYLIYKKIKK